ncbi:hypothetical protein [Asticcacaulis tiandongensis]|uniref:hypothetical protein n=1 Tax=Asticcacaulis tiandongensis TaxID=2565365 RepID=UPI00112E99D0|nr:hypothetical protein [Asticcacaulis tiandongensis]
MNALNAPSAAKPFTRIVNVPSALPWDQMRAARLEAHHTSPVTAASSGLAPTIVVRRLSPWRPGQGGRFVAIYLKGQEAAEGLSFTIEVQGRPVSIVVPSRRKQAEQLRQQATVTGLILLTLVCLSGQVALTLKRRAAAEAELARLEQVVERTARQISTGATAQANARTLEEIGVRGRKAADVLAALQTVTTAKNPHARIDSFLWEGGDWALEVKGDAAPLNEGSVSMQKADRPVRRDTWLWVSYGAGQ